MTSSVFKTDEILAKRLENQLKNKAEEITNFFDCSKEYKEVIFMLMKNDNHGLLKNELFIEKSALFYTYRNKLLSFSNKFNHKGYLRDKDEINREQVMEVLHPGPI